MRGFTLGGRRSTRRHDRGSTFFSPQTVFLTQKIFGIFRSVSARFSWYTLGRGIVDHFIHHFVHLVYWSRFFVFAPNSFFVFCLRILKRGNLRKKKKLHASFARDSTNHWNLEPEKRGDVSRAPPFREPNSLRRGAALLVAR